MQDLTDVKIIKELQEQLPTVSSANEYARDPLFFSGQNFENRLDLKKTTPCDTVCLRMGISGIPDADRPW